MYRSVHLVENYVYFNLDSIDRLAALTRIIGEMAVIGVRLRQPKVNSDHAIRTMDAVNMTTKLELYFSSSKLRLKVDAFEHIIGQPTQNVWLREQLSAVPVVPQQGRPLCLRSKFDYNNNMFKVISANIGTGVVARCIWGDQKGVEVTFYFDEALHLVNLKQG